MTASAERTLRVGLAAFGKVAQVFHAPLITATPGLELAAIASSSSDKVQAAYPEARHVPDARALIADPDVDVVVVTTPNDTHVDLACAALAAGKHVVVEKPVALDAPEAEQLVHAAREAAGRGLVTSVFQNRRWDGDLLALRRVIDDGLVGRVVSLESRFDRFRPVVPDRWRDRPGPGSGVWIDLGPHLVDQAIQLFGMPRWVDADIRTLRDGCEVDDDFHVVLGYERLRVILGGATLAAHPGLRFELRGTAGALLVDGLDPQEAQLAGGMLPGQEGYGLGAPDATLVTADGERAVPRVAGRYQDFYAGVRDAVLTGGEPPVTVEQAWQVMRLIDAAVESSREGRRITV